MHDPNIKLGFERLAKLTSLILSLNDTSTLEMAKEVEHCGDVYKAVLTVNKVANPEPDGSTACLSNN